jgi:hypothetical protein
MGVGVALLMVMLVPSAAWAAKEKFVRSKPHVNIGTIGHVDSAESLLVTLSLVGLPAVTPGASQSCSAELGVRVRDAAKPGEEPVFEEDGIPLRANTGVVVDATPATATDPASPLLYEVTVKGENIDGRHCVFRGLVEVQSVLEGRTTRAVTLRPEDFILLPNGAPTLRR